jgi:hypothetical protein
MAGIIRKSGFSNVRFPRAADRVQGEKGRSGRRRAPAARGRWGATLAAALDGLVVPKVGLGFWARRGASALATMLVLCLSAPAAFAYDFNKPITIDRSMIADASCGGTLANYPMLFSVTDADLAHTGSSSMETDR